MYLARNGQLGRVLLAAVARPRDKCVVVALEFGLDPLEHAHSVYVALLAKSHCSLSRTRGTRSGTAALLGRRRGCSLRGGLRNRGDLARQHRCHRWRVGTSA